MTSRNPLRIGFALCLMSKRPPPTAAFQSRRELRTEANPSTQQGVSLMNLMHLSTLTTLTLCAVLSGCAADSPFPPEVMEKVSPTFHFEAWRDAGPTNESGKSDAGHQSRARRPDRPSYQERQGHRDCRGTTSHREPSRVWPHGRMSREPVTMNSPFSIQESLNRWI